jgi:hypothetical protein
MGTASQEDEQKAISKSKKTYAAKQAAAGKATTYVAPSEAATDRYYIQLIRSRDRDNGNHNHSSCTCRR